MPRIQLLFLAASVLLGPGASGNLQASEAWLRIDRPNSSQREALPLEAIDYGHFIWLPERAAQRLPKATSAHRLERPFDMHMDGRRFDPAEGFPDVAAEWLQTARSEGEDWHLVQFRGPVRPEWLEVLDQNGLKPIQYMAPFAYVVWGRETAIEAARSLAFLRFSGPLPPIMRVPAPSRSAATPGVVTAMALVYGPEAARITAAMEQAGAEVRKRVPSGRSMTLVHLQTEAGSFLELARIPGVLTLQRVAADGGPRGELSGQSITGNYSSVNQILPGYLETLAEIGFDGTGVTVGVVDAGIRETHLDLADRMLPCQSREGDISSCTKANDWHGTHVAGAIAGTGGSGMVDGGGFLRGLGIAPGSKLVQQRYCDFLGPETSCFGEMVPNGMLSIFAETAASGAMIANNSWGPASTPQGYDIPTRHVDMITRDADPDTPGAQAVLPVWAIMNGSGDREAGDCAPSSLGSPDEAKNLLAVGSTALQGSGDETMLDISANSGHGPACDGRLVPHLVAPGCFTDSTMSASDSAHGLACGTSMAAPMVAGAAALFFERFHARHARFPSPALTKAAFTTAARDLAGQRDADGALLKHRPDRKQGWGRIQLDQAVSAGPFTTLIDQSILFTGTGQAWSARFAIVDDTRPVQIQLAWTDAPGPGTGGTTPAWVNDLDLSVEIDGSEYLGNNIDPDSGWSMAGGSPDGMNNLEGVALSTAQHQGKTVTVTVSAMNLAGDALDPWQPSEPRQDFALVGRNLAAPGAPVALEFVDQPTAADAEELLDPVRVRLIDGFGNSATVVDEHEIEVSLNGCNRLSPLSGSTRQSSVNGEAAFDDLVVEHPGVWRLRATSADEAIGEALSASFTVNAPGLFGDRFEAVCLP